jgi:hypothetical protein
MIANKVYSEMIAMDYFGMIVLQESSERICETFVRNHHNPDSYPFDRRIIGILD